ncbi:hypothetical protein SERLA73DRAFT_191122 [Serpula lacrymans var. lacrymans S7.3]|uniref:Uncharacterized protein n=2 Tax=Serpula lacrymans var. lacrymans TaxID=341189 RepID=F8QGY6_SERL3|nr:uncharacterized protein SERLADRAFT_480729 [Serpula lacrymans var. lacrymans S7.9]EGN92468.1 hypothetical protein SERLA73DRAFT_191122 [Serpula lacrymans var. lacrymans S7.3]EGO18596.1 hypothetical protein SERLADRAFT_480729 [Serpula lacrymans var. lacrymans S7.9]
MQTPPSSPAQVTFSSDVRHMDNWAKRTGIPLTTAEALGTTYARAHKWLMSLKTQLVQQHGWHDVLPADSRMLFTVEAPSPWRSPSGLPLSPNLKLQLPVHASSFFSPERRVQWQMVFHSDLFATQRLIVQPITDILNLMQCLLTGLVTLVYEEHMPQGVYKTTRGLPSVQWINTNQAALIDVFGPAHYKQLRRLKSTLNHAVANQNLSEVSPPSCLGRGDLSRDERFVVRYKFFHEAHPNLINSPCMISPNS